MFRKRKIELHITLAEGSFSGGNTKIIKDLACDVSIRKLGLPECNQCGITLYNILPEDMQQLTMLAFQPMEVPHNKITVYAGDEEDGLHVAFSGDILPSGTYADYSSMPNSVLKINAMTGYSASIAPISPTSRKGIVNVAGVIKELAEKAGYTFNSHKVSQAIENPCFSGNIFKQMKDAARDADIDIVLDDNEVVLYGEGGYRQGLSPLISKESGLIGYPSFSQTGIDFKCIYNPQIVQAGLVRVESVVKNATNTWQVIGLTHHITALMPGGAWESEVKTTYV